MMKSANTIKLKWALALMLMTSFSFAAPNAEARWRWKAPTFTWPWTRTPAPAPAPTPTPTPTPTPAPSPAPVPTGTTQALLLANPKLSAQPGQTLHFTTQFNAVPLNKNYEVFVHIVNSANQNVVGADYSPSPSTMQWSGLVIANRSVVLPSDLPAGVYSIRVGLYELVPPYANRVKLSAGPGVIEDQERRYLVGALAVGGSAPAPQPDPTPAPAPAPTPAPAPAPTPTYTLKVSSPGSGATVKGTIQVQGTAPGFLNVEVLKDGQILGRATPNSLGAFSASVDTTKLYNGSQDLEVHAWDSPAGQMFTQEDSLQLSVNVQNAGGSTSPAPAPSPTPAPSNGGGSSVPDGGPGGYTRMVMNDSFGSSKSGANFTSLGQFNQGTYGSSGSGWDDHMCAWDCGKANLTMASDHLELRPTGGKSGFISSRFEFLPTGSQRVYYEIRMATGRGATAPQTWPAIWLFAGNEPGSNNAQSEFDIMETYMNQWDSMGNDSSGYPFHFAVTGHDNANASSDSKIIETPGIDVTTSYNTFGCEVYKGSNGNLQFNIYFNGDLVQSTKTGLSWRSSPPSLFIGWNPGSTSWSPAVMKLDYVKAWVK